MLQMTGLKLEKIFVIDMYLFIENELRGGISYICRRYSEANNKYMKSYPPTKSWKYISYLDEINLYDLQKSGYLPYGGFKWLKNIDNVDVNWIIGKSPVGYIYEAYLKYPEELRELHNDFPLAPQKNLQFFMACCQIIVKNV